MILLKSGEWLISLILYFQIALLFFSELLELPEPFNGDFAGQLNWFATLALIFKNRIKNRSKFEFLGVRLIQALKRISKAHDFKNSRHSYFEICLPHFLLFEVIITSKGLVAKAQMSVQNSLFVGYITKIFSTMKNA